MTKEEAIEELKKEIPQPWDWHRDFETFENAIDIAVKALERETGIAKAQWKYDDSDRTVICSNCQTWFITNGRLVFMRYCPYCGIKMQSDVLVIESEE